MRRVVCVKLLKTQAIIMPGLNQRLLLPTIVHVAANAFLLVKPKSSLMVTVVSNQISVEANAHFVINVPRFARTLFHLPQSNSPWQAKADIKQNCLAYQNVECRSCGETCDTMAIQFVATQQSCTTSYQCWWLQWFVEHVFLCPTAAIHVSKHNIKMRVMYVTEWSAHFKFGDSCTCYSTLNQ